MHKNKNLNSKLPYYSVGAKLFKSKLEALLEATNTGVHPQWHFYDESYQKMCWSQGTFSDVNKLYYQRAKQLRDTYDYIVLSYSGGSDSRTMLESFLNQDIYPDEISTSWPLAATKKYYDVTTDPADPLALLSEWDLCVKPDLEYIRKHYPQITINVDDFSARMLEHNEEITEDDLFLIDDHLTPNVYRKYTMVTPGERKQLDLGKRTAMVWGIEKPQVAYRNGHLYLYFLDKLANTRSTDLHNNRFSELFYWTPDMPEIVHAQGRMLYDYFVKNPNKLYLIDWNSRLSENSMQRKHELNALVRRVIYPRWDAKRFQARKAPSLVWQSHDSWLFEHHSGSRYIQSWHSRINQAKNSVDKKYHQPTTTDRWDGWIGFISPFYDLGEIKL